MSSEFEVQVTEDLEVAQAPTETVRVEHGSPDRARARELFERLAELPADDPERARIRGYLVELHLPLVEYLARRFRNRGEWLDDLTQVATIGLIKSIDRFDLERGVEFSTYVETKDGVLVYATDNEPGDAVFDKAVRKLAEGADVLIYDAQYLPEEYEAHRRGWGHSHWREAVNVVMESGAKELVLFHHDPDHTDAIIDKVVHEARNYYPKVRAAAEGMEIKL